MLRTASIKLKVSPPQSAALSALRVAYADACNRLVPVVREHRLWNRVGLHQRAYTMLRPNTALGSQMICNAIFSVCKAYKTQKELGRISKQEAIPALHFDGASVHYDKRTYTLKGEAVSLNTLQGRMVVGLQPGAHQRRILAAGRPQEAELVARKGNWFFNLVVEVQDLEPLTSGPVMGVDVGENNLAATSTGKVLGGKKLRHRRNQYLALRRRLQSNRSQSARQKLRQVSGKEMRRVRHINHETSKVIVGEAAKVGAYQIVMEDLTHIRSRLKAGKRMRSRLHRWAFRQLLKASSNTKPRPRASRWYISIRPTAAIPAPVVEHWARGTGIVSCARVVVSGRTPT
jgi:putative transposase